MKEPTLPWWRRALQFALGGIVGLFHRNGKTEAAAQIAPQAVPAANHHEASNQETPVKDSSPQSEPVSAQVDAAENETSAKVVVPVAQKPAPDPPATAKEAPPPAEQPPAATVSEPEIPSAPAPEAQTIEAEEAVAIAAQAAPEEATASQPAEEPVSAAADQSQPISTPGPEPSPLPVPVPIDIAPTLPFADKPERTTAEKVAAALKARGEDAEQSPFNVMVNEVYDGPLDLLLDLIRKQDIDIYDIPIAKITAQFLAYVDQLRASDMDVAGEFIYTAALLIHIKSKMLLPRAPAGPDDAAEDPRRELVERLLEHERFKNAAQMLLERQMLEYATWTNPGIREFQEDAGAEPEIAADTTDLVRVFGAILERARNRPILDVEEDSVTVGQMIQFLARRLTMEDKPVALRRLLSHTKSERALIAMFLALLELVRLQAILLRQDRHFSEIFIKKHTGFEALMNQGLANARDDWR
ncbi:MAG: segregation/condensation protein A [Terracidiphilus sp.]|jgi:segregation and condensation protein A